MCSYFWNQYLLARDEGRKGLYAQTEENLVPQFSALAVFLGQTHCFPARTVMAFTSYFSGK